MTLKPLLRLLLSALALRTVAALDNGVALRPPMGWRSWSEQRQHALMQHPSLR